MKLVIKKITFGGVWTVVKVGSQYNDTNTTQVKVLQINQPNDAGYMAGMIYVQEMSLTDTFGWYNPNIIGAEWVEV